MTVAEAPDTALQQTDQPSLELPLDAEHSGIRTVGCLSFFIAVPIAFLLLSLILPNIPVLAGILAIPLGVVVSWLIERYLRQNWPSGRKLIASDTRIEIRRHNEVQRSVDPQQNVNILAWHFIVPRNGRVKKGWHVIGLSLEQNETYVPIYTFANPETFEKMPFAAQFVRLERKKEADSNVAKSASSMRVAGQQRRLYDAEQDRGINGGELTFEQFTQLLNYLHERYPEWIDS